MNFRFVFYLLITFLAACNASVHNENDLKKIGNSAVFKAENSDTSLYAILQRISEKALILDDIDYPEKAFSSQWLGALPATEDEIRKAQRRLNIELPNDYLDFLRTTNGFLAPSAVHPGFHSVNKIDYLKNVDPFLVSIWMRSETQDVGEKMERSIIVGGIHDDQHFFLIPPQPGKNEGWEYWTFASWYPGEIVHPDLKTYWMSVDTSLTNLGQWFRPGSKEGQ